MPFITQGKTISSSAQIEPGVIVDSDINASAAIQATKIQALDIGVNGGVIPSTGIVNAHVKSDAAIALSKLETGTQGDVLIRTTSGVTSAVAIGASGSFLKSNGAGADPSWGAASNPIFVPLSWEDGAGQTITDETLVRSTAASGITACYGVTFVPSGTISSIQILGKAAASGSGSIILDFTFSCFTDGAAVTADTLSDQSYSDFASNTNWQLITVDASAYNGLTQNKIWSFKVRRNGDHASDTLGQAVLLSGLLINL